MANNAYGIDWDFPGFCALCHVQIADFDGWRMDYVPNIVRMRPEATSVVVDLDNGSKMRVNVCTNCQVLFKPEDAQTLMESVIRGWQYEVDHRLTERWSPEKREAHLKEYRKRFVTDWTDAPWNDDEKKKVRKPRLSKLTPVKFTVDP